MNLELILGPEAEAEIAEGGDWYDRQNPGLRVDFIRAVEQDSRRSSKTLFSTKLSGENIAAQELLDSLTA